MADVDLITTVGYGVSEIKLRNKNGQLYAFYGGKWNEIDVYPLPS